VVQESKCDRHNTGAHHYYYCNRQLFAICSASDFYEEVSAACPRLYRSSHVVLGRESLQFCGGRPPENAQRYFFLSGPAEKDGGNVMRGKVDQLLWASVAYLRDGRSWDSLLNKALAEASKAEPEREGCTVDKDVRGYH
jgi:hypothetical protein